MNKNKELISKIGLRLDGRRNDELRRIRCKLGVYSVPNGSAYLEQGLTKVLAAVYGPHDVRSRRYKGLRNSVIVNCQFSMAVFSTGERKKRPRGDRKSCEMSDNLKQALTSSIRTELYPGSQIDVYIEVLHADGGVFPVCVNAATLALIDAGIPLKDYVCACAATLADYIPLLDVSYHEETVGGPTLTVAALPSTNKIVLMEMSKKFHIDHLPKVLEMAMQGCRDIRDILKDAVKDHVTKVGMTSAWAILGDRIYKGLK